MPRTLLVVTTTLACWMLDVDSGQAWRFHEGQGVYYGLTFDETYLYVAARDAAYGSERETQDNLILCFDRDLRLVRTLRSPRPIRDVHQIAQHGGLLYIVSTYDDCVMLYDLADDRWEVWLPFGSGSINHLHINSIHVDDDRLLLAGNKPHGWYAAFDRHRAPLGQGRTALGRGTHNVWPEGDGTIAVCSSLDGCVMSLAWRRPPVRPYAWLRGVARLGARTALGVSQNRVRNIRGKNTDCSIVLLDEAGTMVGCRSFHGYGMAHDIRALGVRDATHNGLVFTLRDGALDRMSAVFETTPVLVDLDPPPQPD